ncbi:MAG: hypothetical protein ACXVZX_16775, partial [Terriglobales bacterium]
PVVIGVQAAEKPPRYVPVAKLRTIMKSRRLEAVQISDGPWTFPAPEIRSMMKPQETTQAEMLAGSPDEVAAKLADALLAHGLM